MTGSEDSNSSTRPISVAELLARNGTIGAPPVGGRRRRRRGNADAVTVAELTGEIPVIRPDDPAPAADAAAQEAEPGADIVDDTVEESGATDSVPEPDVDAAASTNGVVDHGVESADEEVDAVTVDDEAEDGTDEIAGEADIADEADIEVAAEEADKVAEEADKESEEAGEADLENAADDQEDSVGATETVAATEKDAATDEEDVEPEGSDAVPERTPRFRFGRFGRKDSGVDAEDWTPDPVDEADDPADADVTAEREIEDLDDETAMDSDDARGDDDELPSYLRSTEEPLFGGQTVADDLARRGSRPAPTESDDLGEPEDEDRDADKADDAGRAEEAGSDEPRRMSTFVNGAWIVGQSIVAVIFGAGLFVAFDQLWKWNNIVALVLSVLVILGLVVGVRVVRKTEDIGSTLIAVAVGALVTLGPLALLQSG